MKSIKWKFHEYEEGGHSLDWYIKAGLAVFVLASYALYTGNFLFAAILVIFSFIVYITDKQPPKMVDCELSEDGIIVGGEKYELSQINKFWIIYQPPKVKNLYIELKRKFMPRLTIPLADQNPLPIREFLLKYFEEDLEQENEPISDVLNRYLKL